MATIKGKLHDGRVQVGNLRLRNPIPSIVKQNYSGFFAKRGIAVPYSSDNQYHSHKLLDFLYGLYESAPTLKSLHRAKSTYCFGGGLDLQGKKNKGFVSERQTIGEESKGEFVQWLEGIGLDGGKILDLTKCLYKDEVICGTQYLQVRIAEKDGVYSTSATWLHPLHVVRLFNQNKPKDNLSNSVLVDSEPITSGTSAQLNDNRFIAPLFPLVQRRKGAIETVFQMNAEGYEGELYGRPSANVLWNYVDYESGNYMGKVTQNEITAASIIFMQDPNMGTEQDTNEALDMRHNIAQGIRETMTSKGEAAQGLGVMWYPHEKPTLEQIPVNRDSSFWSMVVEEARRQIAGGVNFDPRLIGLDSFKSSIGSSIYLQTLMGTNEFSIAPTQERYVQFWDKVLGFLFEHTEETRFEGLSLKFESKIDNLIAKIVESNNTNVSTNNTTQQSDG